MVTTNTTPTGIFTAAPDPVLAVGGAVDESLFIDADGTGYVIHNTTQVAAGLTADMVVERLTPDYLSTTGQYVRLGLGDIEALAAFKGNGLYHALMSDPSCAYCSGSTGEMTATSMLGPWSGAWYDPDGAHQIGRPEPRWRARIVNADNCGGQPLATLPITAADRTTGYYFVSDRWSNRAPNESLANFFIGPMTFDTAGTLQDIGCTPSFLLRLRSATTGGCYGWEYNDSGPYPSGVESYSTDDGASFTAEPGRDLKFSTDVSAAPAFAAEGVPPGFTRCAGESERCAFGEGGSCTVAGPTLVAYGAAGADACRLVGSGQAACTNDAFGRDPLPNVVKSCYLPPAAGPPGWTACAVENGICTPGSARTVFMERRARSMPGGRPVR